MKRVFVCLALVTLSLLSFPALVADESRNVTAISAVAYAGHSVPSGRWCECGTANCVCDPGEEPCTVCPSQQLTVQGAGEEPDASADQVDLGAAFSLMVAATLLVLRLRQIL